MDILKKLKQLGYTEDPDYLEVYRATAPSGKVYIGITKNLITRIKSHYSSARLRKTYFHHALIKYGVEIKWDILGGANNSAIDELERFFISLYRSMDPKYGYNLLSGGRSGFSVPGKLKKIHAQVWTEERKRKQSENYIGSKNPMFGRSDNGKQISVQCLDDHRIFVSITAAAKHYGLSIGNVCSVCKGTLRTTGGLRFKYV